MSDNRNIRFFKYHALGNDYLVLDPADWTSDVPPPPVATRKICHRNYGLGSDGILWGPFAAAAGCFGLRIFNPDGSEAEKSGNGLRIFARYLFDRQRVAEGKPFRVSTPGGVVECVVLAGGAAVRVEMGRVSFDSEVIPVLLEGERREVINEQLVAGGREFCFCAATIGNPHCVVPVEKATPELARKFGPLIETHPLFPNRTNVQFLEVIGRGDIRIEIWERGAGYTLASGSSSSAAAAVARKLGAVGRDVTVHMPGGRLNVTIADDFSVTMTGGVTPVGEFLMRPDVLAQQVVIGDVVE